MDSQNSRKAALVVGCVLLISVAASAGCGRSEGLSALGGGLPGCDSTEAQRIAKSALMNHLRYSEGNICFMQDSMGAEPDPVGRAGFRPDPLGQSMADCRDAPNGRRFIPVHDFKFDLKDYLVEAESRAQDGRSVTCEISTAYELGSREQSQFSGGSATRKLTIRYFGKTDSGDRRYEAAVRRLY